MEGYEGSQRMTELGGGRDGDGAVGRDPGDILEGAINLWCYYLRLEADPLAFRSGEELPLQPQAAHRRDPNSSRTIGMREA